MSTMRQFVAVLSVGVAVVITGCSGDSSNSGGSGGSTGTGTTGAGGASPGNACRNTKCADPFALTDQACDALLMSSCADQARAYFACSLAHDTCKADGTQDGSMVATSCSNETHAFVTCNPNGDGGIY